MSTIDASLTTGASGAGLADDVTAQLPIMVHSCNRLGRVAKPSQHLVRRLVPLRASTPDPNRQRRRMRRTTSARTRAQGRPATLLPPAS